MNDTQKHIHFIGICGVGMGALAVAFQKAGWKVTGSDKGFYPPVSTHLSDAGVAYYPGWHVEKMTASGDPNLVVVGNVAGSQNPEFLYVKEKQIPYGSYPEVIAQYLIKPHSIVCAGTYGKTTSSGLMAWILRDNGFDPSYMFGGISLNDIDAAHISNSSWSILEGDEYRTSGWDTRPKFSHYSPTHLLLTSVVWDHADVYPTEEGYRQAFRQLINTLPQQGLLVASEKVPSQIISSAQCPVITYGKKETNHYRYTDVKQTKDELSFDIKHKDTTNHISLNVLGEYMADNITGCFALAEAIGVEPEKIIASLKTFAGLRRRLEKRYIGSVSVFDDIAHSPSKAVAVLESLRVITDGKLITIFEPNTGNRQPEAIPGYNHAFVAADIVIIPRLTKLKHDPKKQPSLEGADLAHVIQKTHSDVRYIDEDRKLVETIIDLAAPGDTIVFLGSHSFRGMIDDVCDELTFPRP